MLVSAKLKNQPFGKNGAIALLRNNNNDFKTWDILSPVSSPECYSEMEVAQLFFNSKGNYELVFSSSFKHNEEVIKNKVGGLYSIGSTDLINFNNNQPREILPLKSCIYAGRVIPELNGDIISFDTDTGGLSRSGINTEFRNVDRDFTNFEIDLPINQIERVK